MDFEIDRIEYDRPLEPDHNFLDDVEHQYEVVFSPAFNSRVRGQLRAKVSLKEKNILKATEKAMENIELLREMKMSDDRLPSGVNASDIPGNRPIDKAYDKFLNEKLGELFKDYYDERPDYEEESYEKYFFEKDVGFIDFCQTKFEEGYHG